MSKEFLWVEKYRPNIVEDCILPASIKEVFQGFVNQGELPNLLLSGTAGVGKTTIAKVSTGCDHLAVVTDELAVFGFGIKIHSWGVALNAAEHFGKQCGLA